MITFSSSVSNVKSIEVDRDGGEKGLIEISFWFNPSALLRVNMTREQAIRLQKELDWVVG